LIRIESKAQSIFFSRINHNSSSCSIYRWFGICNYFKHFDLDCLGQFIFVVKSYFILGSSKATLNRYFGDTSQVSISCQIQVICLSCFAYYESRSLVLFEIDSELTCIESNAFHHIRRSNQSRFFAMFKFFVHRVSHVARHFHRFHLKRIHN
jgi:hypothetical protein